MIALETSSFGRHPPDLVSQAAEAARLPPSSLGGLRRRRLRGCRLALGGGACLQQARRILDLLLQRRYATPLEGHLGVEFVDFLRCLGQRGHQFLHLLVRELQLHFQIDNPRKTRIMPLRHILPLRPFRQQRRLELLDFLPPPFGQFALLVILLLLFVPLRCHVLQRLILLVHQILQFIRLPRQVGY